MPLPDIATVDRQTAPASWHVFKFQQSTDGSETIILREGCDGDPVDLTGKFLRFVAKDHYSNTTLYLDVTPTIVTAADGEVQVDVSADDLWHPGVFFAEFVVYDVDPEVDDTAVAQKRYPAYMQVSQTLEDALTGLNHGIRIADIRMAMWDRCAEDNFLLDEVMFADDQIAFAVTRPVDLWNELPPIFSKKYSAADFPYKYHWINATIGELYMMAAHNYMRNHLSYQAHGVAVNDKDKYQHFLQMGREMKAEYKEWVSREKLQLNVNAAFGSAGVRHYG